MKTLFRRRDGALDEGPEPGGREPGGRAVDDDRIAAVGERLDASDADRVIDGEDLLLMPGMVNAHIHTEQNTFRGRYPGLPLEVLMLYAYSLAGASPMDAEMIHHRTLLAGIESLKSGVTFRARRRDRGAAPGARATGRRVRCLRADRDAANISGHVMNRPFFETIPYLEETLPERLKEKFLRVRRSGSTSTWTSAAPPWTGSTEPAMGGCGTWWRRRARSA